jgi:hypothetical protein
MWDCGLRCFSTPVVALFLPPRMGPMSGSFNWSVLRDTESQPAPATTATPRICLTYARASTLWQWVHSSWQGHHERASALLCFRPWRCSEVKLYSCRCWICRRPPFFAGPRSFPDWYFLFISPLLLGRHSNLLGDSRLSLGGPSRRFWLLLLQLLLKWPGSP